MKTYQNFLQTGIILLIIALNSFAIGNAIRLESGWAIILSIGSLLALGYCIHLFRKLKQLDTEDEFENNY